MEKPRLQSIFINVSGLQVGCLEFISYVLPELDQDEACTGKISSRKSLTLHLCF